jgi:hemolysin III
VRSVELHVERPTWRGVLHVAAFVVAVPAGIALISAADGASGRTASAIYAATLLLLFGTSAAYHRLPRTERARAIMQRLDHSMIYLLIAGTYVPLCLVALPLEWGIPLLAVIGTCAVTGVVLKVTAFDRARWVSYSLYPIMGWAAVAAAPALLQHLAPIELALVLAGGIAYTVGMPVLLTRRPDPWPRSFGYHEVWHSFTVVAAGLHFAAVAAVVS